MGNLVHVSFKAEVHSFISNVYIVSHDSRTCIHFTDLSEPQVEGIACFTITGHVTQTSGYRIHQY